MKFNALLEIALNQIPRSDWERDLFDFVRRWAGPDDFIEVKTSGSTGLPKLIRHKKEAMRQSARMTCDFLGLQPSMTALVCLSTRNIAGMMMVVRAFERDLNILLAPPSSHPLRYFDEPVTIDFCAMVPAQVYNSLRDEDERVKIGNIKNIIIGGAPVSHALQQEIARMPGKVWSTFGMTETMSHIAMRKLNGPDASEEFRVLEGITIETGKKGNLIIHAPYLSGERIVTNDLVEITGFDKFRWLGRADHVINSGGNKIFPEKIESIIAPVISAFFRTPVTPDDPANNRNNQNDQNDRNHRNDRNDRNNRNDPNDRNNRNNRNEQTGEATQRYFIAPMKHERLGQVPVLVVEHPAPSEGEKEAYMLRLHQELSPLLARHEMPRDIWYVKKFVETPTGKIIRSATLKRLKAKG